AHPHRRLRGRAPPAGRDRPGAQEQSDRWPEGLLVGVYLGALGAISVIALIAYFR
ncbi:MAG: hypothetical protein H7X74_07610, partial [Methyloceanibacter sp.]|nr:hypothetical protein [Methyloceanibacter sp.]